MSPDNPAYQDRVYICQLCACRFKGVGIEMWVGDHLQVPVCPLCGYWVRPA